MRHDCETPYRVMNPCGMSPFIQQFSRRKRFWRRWWLVIGSLVVAWPIQRNLWASFRALEEHQTLFYLTMTSLGATSLETSATNSSHTYEYRAHPRMVALQNVHVGYFRSNHPSSRSSIFQSSMDWSTRNTTAFTNASEGVGTTRSHRRHRRRHSQFKRWDSSKCQIMDNAWRTTQNQLSTCNVLHEYPLSSSPSTTTRDPTLQFNPIYSQYLGSGLFRSAWMWKDSAGNGSSSSSSSTMTRVVYKTLQPHVLDVTPHVNHDVSFLLESTRIDVMAMERFTNSPYVINVYGYCGWAVLTQAGDRTLTEWTQTREQEQVVDTTERLRMGTSIAKILAQIHYGFPIETGPIETRQQESFLPILAHGDFNRNNLLVLSDGRIAANDFNQGMILRGKQRNVNTTTPASEWIPCRYTNRKNNGLMYFQRPPERFDMNGHVLLDKVDVFGLGNILMELVTGWDRAFQVDLLLADEETLRQPRIVRVSKALYHSNNTATMAMIYAALACYSFVPENRPTALRIAAGLETALHWIKDNGKTTTTTKDIQRLFLDDPSLFATLLEDEFDDDDDFQLNRTDTGPFADERAARSKNSIT